jgi:hypothetical protein
MPIGLLTINQALTILNMPCVPDGDKRLQSLNFVNANMVDDYQLGNGMDAHHLPSVDNGEDISKISINGAQIQGLLSIVNAMNEGSITIDAAVTLIVSAFPFDRGTAKKILGKYGGIEDEKK